MAAVKLEELRISNIIRKSVDDNRILTLQDLIQLQQDWKTLIDKINYDNNGADYVKQLDGTTAVSSNKLSLNDNGDNSAYGVYEIINKNINIAGIFLSTWPTTNFKKIIIKPAPGRQIIIQETIFTSAEIDCIVGELFGGSVELVGDNGDYVTLEKVYVNQTNCVFAKYNKSQ